MILDASLTSRTVPEVAHAEVGGAGESRYPQRRPPYPVFLLRD
jgi:hypothetical protein